MNAPMTLISHVLCPYVQRVAIVLSEKGLVFQRRDIDLTNKPAWFLELSPTEKTPLLLVGDTPLFESSVICEYLEEVHEPRLHPGSALERARHRAWMEFASTLLSAIASLYNAPTEQLLADKVLAVRRLLERIEGELGDGPYFDGSGFSMVDVAFAPAFRYFNVVDKGNGFRLLEGLPRVDTWRGSLAARPSVQQGVVSDYEDRLHAFLLKRGTALSRTIDAATHARLPVDVQLD